MAVQRIAIDELLAFSASHPIIDVRSPSEYGHAHIPQALSIPIFDDEQRKIIGTAYKQQSREQAIKLGLDFFGLKMRSMVENLEQTLNDSNKKTIVVHCWRGGMRSAAVAWLFDLYGYKVYTLQGGYKAYRNWVLRQFSLPYQLRVLSGYTGSGKTEILKELSKEGLPVIDLEALAGHRGSAFGQLGLPQQASNEQFENQLANALAAIRLRFPKQATIWVESESSRIGNLNIHPDFFEQMKKAERIQLNIPFAQRLAYIMAGYGAFPTNELISATERIKNRLGGLDTKTTIAHLTNGATKEAFAILLQYYDRYYDKSKTLYEKAAQVINLDSTDTTINTQYILKQLNLK